MSLNYLLLSTIFTTAMVESRGDLRCWCAVRWGAED